MPTAITFGSVAARAFGFLGRVLRKDAFFNYVTLLLTGNGTNGAQNNTFLDSSTNNFTITRNGNTTQGAFSPYGDKWSNYFDGSGDSIQTVSSSLWTWSTSTSWTIEAFVFPLTRASVQPIYGAFAGSPGSGTNNGELLIETTGQITFRYWNGAEQKVTTSGTVPLSTWTHVVMAFDGTNIAIYINGTRSANTAINGTPDSTTNTLYLGTTRFGTSGDTQLYFTGYISNARVVRNSVVYSGATISVPTVPLTVITGTQLLTCADNRFIDDSSNNFAITRNGDVSVQRFSPFNPTAPYATGTIGGSGYFDGSGDYLTAPNNSALSVGTGQFWFEAWIWMPTAPSSQYIVLGTNSSSLSSSALTIRIQPSALRVDRHGVIAYDSGIITWQYNAWQHIAVGRDSGNTLYFFVNGVASGTRSATTDNFAGESSAIGWIPIDAVSSNYFNGFISSARLLKGTCLYTSSFTPPTAPPADITNTSLLLNFINGGIIDNAMMNDLETVGNAQISTSVSRFGGGSLAFDGNGDYLQLPSGNQIYNLSSGDWTIECWVYFNTFTTNSSPHFVSFGADNSNRCAFWREPTTGKFRFTTVNSGSLVDATGTTTVATATWYHVALVRLSGTSRLYVNGVQEATSTSAIPSGTNLAIGFMQFGGLTADYVNGNIDDLRITKGYARYTANFTPPGPLPLY